MKGPLAYRNLTLEIRPVEGLNKVTICSDGLLLLVTQGKQTSWSFRDPLKECNYLEGPRVFSYLPPRPSVESGSLTVLSVGRSSMCGELDLTDCIRATVV